MGGSGAGSGGNAAVPGCDAPAALAALAAVTGSEAPFSAIAAEAGAVADAARPAFAVAVGVSLAGVAGVAEAAWLAAALPALGADAEPGALGAMPSGRAGPGGVAEKLLGGNGGRDGAPVDDVFVPAGVGGGVCRSCAMLTLVCLFAVA
ncbi:hypothetical protein J2801_002646 [Paraburkholderia phenoliruptrix]|nr:hypothetical protein [Paraburkholderia phenoliruptrix]